MGSCNLSILSGFLFFVFRFFFLNYISKLLFFFSISGVAFSLLYIKEGLVGEDGA